MQDRRVLIVFEYYPTPVTFLITQTVSVSVFLNGNITFWLVLLFYWLLFLDSFFSPSTFTYWKWTVTIPYKKMLLQLALSSIFFCHQFSKAVINSPLDYFNRLLIGIPVTNSFTPAHPLAYCQCFCNTKLTISFLFKNLGHHWKQYQFLSLAWKFFYNVTATYFPLLSMLQFSQYWISLSPRTLESFVNQYFGE